ncbi:aminoglycoside phosphotransferase family protein [Streptomyces sp. YGL11-2]|uniref:aminoglycoside phosphotransferase family protein n=1 Tax=Streptomyces sp. YGL11-2 TaxID=3414028 RepID=UPI003CF5EAD3
MSAGDTPPDDVAISTALVRRLIAAQFPQWSGLPLTPVATQGVDNATYRLGHAMSVRLPCHSRWVGQVAREQHWLPFLAPHLPLSIPVPLAEGAPSGEYPFPWSVHRWLDGERALPERLADPRQAATDLAQFLAALRRVDTAGGPPPEWSNGFRGVAMDDVRDSAVAARRLRSRIAALEGLVDTDALTAVWQAAASAPAWEGPPVWIHGDPSPGNVLAVDGQLGAVIDFGTLAVGDPACDLIGPWTLLPADARAVFRAALPVDEATWARGRGWALTALLPSPGTLTGGDPVPAARARQRLDELIADFRGHG